jgi:hypothetical protein
MALSVLPWHHSAMGLARGRTWLAPFLVQTGPIQDQALAAHPRLPRGWHSTLSLTKIPCTTHSQQVHQQMSEEQPTTASQPRMKAPATSWDWQHQRQHRGQHQRAVLLLLTGEWTLTAVTTTMMTTIEHPSASASRSSPANRSSPELWGACRSRQCWMVYLLRRARCHRDAEQHRPCPLRLDLHRRCLHRRGRSRWRFRVSWSGRTDTNDEGAVV